MNAPSPWSVPGQGRPPDPAVRPEGSAAAWSPASEPAEWPLADLRPARSSIVADALGRLVLVGVALGVGVWLGTTDDHAGAGVRLALGSLLAGVLVLAWEAVKRDSNRYALSNRRVMWRTGVLRRALVEAPLANVQSVVLTRSLRERVLGLGTLRMSTAAVGAPDVVWRRLARPEAILAQVRDALDRYAGFSDLQPHSSLAAMSAEYPSPDPAGLRRMPVIGIAGGIGAGKSTVARAFEKLGCYVIDSDVRAKEALDRPDVRDTLVQWWGGSILNDQGRVDRAKIASIIFADAAQRQRLEALVHPIVRQDRARMVAEAARFWAKGVIVDAPLLFEAGVDRECDVVVFVDAAREARLERVRRTRGWDEPELTRREASQLPIEHKRARCRFVVDNTTPEAVDAQVRAILEQIRQELRA